MYYFSFVIFNQKVFKQFLGICEHQFKKKLYYIFISLLLLICKFHYKCFDLFIEAIYWRLIQQPVQNKKQQALKRFDQIDAKLVNSVNCS